MPHSPALTAITTRHVLVAVFCGGVIGGVARAIIESAFGQPAGEVPWSTLAINLAGAALLGWLAAKLHEREPDESLRHPLLMTGFCGALTTFSTLQLELAELVRGGHDGTAALYLGLSLAGGMASVAAGRLLARRTGPHA